MARRVLAGLSPAERRKTAALLGYPEGSVGRYMTPEVVALHRGLTTAGAFLTMLVPVAVFLALQRYFIRGLTSGAVKG